MPRPRCPTPRLPYVVHNGLSIRSVGDLSHFLTVSLYLTLIDTEYLNPVLHLYPPQQPLPLQLPPMLPEQSLPMLPISSRPEIQFLRYALCMLTAFFLAVTPLFAVISFAFSLFLFAFVVSLILLIATIFLFFLIAFPTIAIQFSFPFFRNEKHFVNIHQNQWN